MTTYTRAADISAEINTRLAAILVTNGCETDIGADVQLGRRKVPADDETPCTQLVEAPDTVEDTAGRMQAALVKARIRYLIDAFDRCDPKNPNVKAHAMIRDIKRAIFKGGNRTFGGLVAEVAYKGRDIGARPDGSPYVQVRVVIEVSYAEDLANP